MSNEDLKLIQSIDGDTQWIKIEHGVVCGLDKVIILAITREQTASLATELLDARARLASVGKEEN